MSDEEKSRMKVEALIVGLYLMKLVDHDTFHQCTSEGNLLIVSRALISDSANNKRASQLSRLSSAKPWLDDRRQEEEEEHTSLTDIIRVRLTASRWHREICYIFLLSAMNVRCDRRMARFSYLTERHVADISWKTKTLVRDREDAFRDSIDCS